MMPMPMMMAMSIITIVKKKDKMMMETKMVPGKKKTNNFGVLVFLLQNYD